MIKYSVRRFLSPKRLVHCGGHLEWLGLKSRKVSLEFLKRGVSSIGWHSSRDQSPSGARLDEATASNLRLIARYPVSVASERTLFELDSNPELYEDLFEEWTDRLAAEYVRMSIVFDRFQPQVVLLVQGYEFSNAVARAIVIERNLRPFAIENTALKDRMLWENISGITTNRSLASSFYWRFVDSVSDNHARDFTRKLIANTKCRKQDEHSSPHNRMSLDKGKPIVLFLGQVYTDSSVLFGIGNWQKPEVIVLMLAEMSRELDFKLVIKLHPKENSGTAVGSDRPYNRITYRRLCEDGKLKEMMDSGEIIVDYDNRFDTYSLIENAKVAVTINSQAGLEAAIRGVPTITCGHAFYGSHGFTYNASEPQILGPLLGAALDIDPAELEKRTLEAQRFTTIYFEQYCIEKTEVSLVDAVMRRGFNRA